MRINFARSLIKDAKRQILNDLIVMLCDDYDLDIYQTREWIKSKNGIDCFIKYLNKCGYKVKKYSWPDEKTPRSIGLEFDDNDPLVIALKLKYIDNDK